MNVVCYTGGTCGDLISAMLDNSGARFKNSAVQFAQDRVRLKKPHLFNSNNEKDQYLTDIKKQYKSIPSHDLKYHIERKHKFIGITVQDQTLAIWAATRFQQLHRPHVWDEMTAFCGASTIESYAQMMIDFSNLITQHTDDIITLESICNGTLLDNPILQNVDVDFYQSWLELQNLITL